MSVVPWDRSKILRCSRRLNDSTRRHSVSSPTGRERQHTLHIGLRRVRTLDRRRALARDTRVMALGLKISAHLPLARKDAGPSGNRGAKVPHQSKPSSRVKRGFIRQEMKARRRSIRTSVPLRADHAPEPSLPPTDIVPSPTRGPIPLIDPQQSPATHRTVRQRSRLLRCGRPASW